MSENYINKLKEIFEQNNDKRILVIGTSCTGKSTLIEKLGIGIDMDKEIFPLLTQEDKYFITQAICKKGISKKRNWNENIKRPIR